MFKLVLEEAEEPEIKLPTSAGSWKMQEILVRFQGQEDPLENEMATHSSILAWRIPWTEESGQLQFVGSQSWSWLSDWVWTVNFRMFKLVLEEAEEPEIKLPTSAGSSKKQENSRKTSLSALLTMPKPLTVWITINCGKFWKRWEYQTTWPASWEIYMQVRKQQLELDMEQQTGSK